MCYNIPALKMEGNMIGRQEEQQELNRLYNSKESEFLAVNCVVSFQSGLEGDIL